MDLERRLCSDDLCLYLSSDFEARIPVSASVSLRSTPSFHVAMPRGTPLYQSGVTDNGSPKGVSDRYRPLAFEVVIGRYGAEPDFDPAASCMVWACGDQPWPVPSRMFWADRKTLGISEEVSAGPSLSISKMSIIP